MEIEEIKDLMLTTKGGTPKASSRENVRIILAKDCHYQGLFRYNDFLGQIEYRKNIHASFSPITDQIVTEIGSKIERFYRYIPTDNAVIQGITLTAIDHSYNPIKQRIEKEKWDNKKRCETFFIDYLGAEDSEYTRAVTKTWLVGLISRVYKPGCKVDIMPVLVGKQGIGKSTLVSLLCPPRYFEDGLQTMGKFKDDLLKLHDAWVVEISELDAMSKTDISKTKAFITATNDKYRAPYAHITEEHPRKNLFIGTTNQGNFLRDLTGARRFYPIVCHERKTRKSMPNPGEYNDHNILQILAEAKAYYDMNKDCLDDILELSEDVKKQAQVKQQAAMIQDQQVELMIEYSNLLVPDEWDTLSIYQRRQYWQRYKDDGKYVLVSEKFRTDQNDENEKNNFNVLTSDELQPMQQFSNIELLEVVFGQEGKEVARGGRNKLTSKLSMTFDNDENWKQSNNVKLYGKAKRGYKRIKQDS